MDPRQATERFYQLVWPRRAAILRTARILTGDVTEAEDLAQEVMMKAFKAIDRFEGGRDVFAWLLTILRHARIDRIRSSRSEVATVSLEQTALDPADRRASPEQWSNPEEVLNAFSDQQIIAALQKLPEDLRWTLLLVDVQQMEQQDAGRVLGIPTGTVKSRLHRGRAVLREALAPLALNRR